MDKTLNNLVKISKRSIDEKRKELASVQDKKDRILFQIERAHKSLEEEIRTAENSGAGVNDQIRRYLPRYKQNVLNFIDELEDDSRKFDPEIEKLNDQIAEIFIEMKKYELIRDNKLEEERKERERKRQLEVDELALEKFIRNENG